MTPADAEREARAIVDDRESGVWKDGWCPARKNLKVAIELSILRIDAQARRETWEAAAALLAAQQSHEPYYGSAIFKGQVVERSGWIEKVRLMFCEQAEANRER